MIHREPWTLSSEDVFALFDVDPQEGLSLNQVQFRQNRFGPNQIETQGPPRWYIILARQFKSLLVALLVVAALVAGLSGDVLDALAIFLVLLVNALIGFVTEIRAVTSMESLRKMGTTTSRVLRQGRQKLVPSSELVPGDILLLEAGDINTADGRIIEAHNLNVDESALTGESVPVEKSSYFKLESKAPLSERQNMLMKGTHITRGVGRAVVTNTGMNTELGKIAILTSTAQEEITPLEKRLDRLGRKLVWMTLLISLLIFVTGWLSGKDPLLMIQTAIALAVATVPEGLPVVATISLAKGLWIMASKNALVKKLSAVETLGATSIVITDKTGTLTENQMTVSTILTAGGKYLVKASKDSQKLSVFTRENKILPFSKMDSQLKRFVEVAGLCNDAQYAIEGTSMGDPMEVALLRFADEVLTGEVDLKKQYPRISEVPFDSQSKRMATVHRQRDDVLIAVKGAPEAVIDRSRLDEEEQQYWKSQNAEMAETGLRVLAMAFKENPKEGESLFEDLIFLGLIGLIDPARQDVPQAIRQCQKAGIRVIMATGDQAGTAVKIASDIGLSQPTITPVSGSDLSTPWSESLITQLQTTSIFNRVSPEQKLQLVEFYQKQGAVVAMTGDGVNDAPALKKADIGVAMGLRGTEVAKEAADMVLKDDRFETIVFAIQQGRIIFSNIRKFVIYLLSCNISEVLVVGLASLINTKLPITPLQILFLNLVTDVFPALALGMGQGDSTYLSQPPRKSDEKILENRHWWFIFTYGSLITLAVLGVFYLSLYSFHLSIEKVVTMSFLTLGVSQIFHVFNLRKSESRWLLNDITKNPHVWGAVILCLALLLISVHFSVMQEALDLVPLTLQEWMVVVGASLIPSLGQFLVKLD